MGTQTVTISMTITPDDGGKPVVISASYPGNEWADVLEIEKAVLPPIMAALFKMGEDYAAAAKRG